MKRARWRPLLLLSLVGVALILMAYIAVNAAGQGHEKAQALELRNLQQAVFAMMADNQIATLPNPVSVPTSDMSLFPDPITPPETKGMMPGDKPGYLLHGHDIIADGRLGPLTYYVVSMQTSWTYTVSRAGIVAQAQLVTE